MQEIILPMYFASSTLGIIAMIPQLRRLIITKQSDGLSLTTWGTWACCQVVSLIYALSVGARAYAIVCVVWIAFYWTMSILIIKYRKRRSLLETILYWHKRGRDEKKHPVLGMDSI